MTTTPSTAELRAWARKNGLAVSNRGRLPDQVHQAWQDARKPAGRKSRRAQPSEPPPVVPAGSDLEARVETLEGQLRSLAAERSIAELAEQITALLVRVERLEQLTADKPRRFSARR